MTIDLTILIWSLTLFASGFGLGLLVMQAYVGSLGWEQDYEVATRYSTADAEETGRRG